MRNVSAFLYKIEEFGHPCRSVDIIIHLHLGIKNYGTIQTRNGGELYDRHTIKRDKFKKH